MKLYSERNALIREAQTDPAEEGTAWRDRVERWMALSELWVVRLDTNPFIHFYADTCASKK